MNKKFTLFFILIIILIMSQGSLSAQAPASKEEISGKGPESGLSWEKESQETIALSQKGETGPEMVIESENNDLMSLNFIDVDIKEALSALAIEREINIATAQDVSGKISVHLYRVDLNEALDAITMAGGLSYQKYGDLYYVSKKLTEPPEPPAERLQMRIFKLKYAEVDRVQEILSALPGVRTVRIHPNSKTVVVEDTQENIAKIETILSHWDRKPRQVMIEAKILEITLTDEMSFGVNWNDILGDVLIGTGGFSTATIPTTGPISPVPSTGKGIFSNLISAAGTNKQFTAALDALQAKTRVETLSTPKILAINGKPAKVQVGGQQGYRVTTTNVGVATETIEFIDTGTILEITPFIDDENNVLLDVKPSIRAARIEQGIPVVNSTEVSTSLMAKNGETVFIGGLIQDKKTRTREMVPCLGSMAGMGILFGRTFRGIGKSELVVLITPNILDAGPNPMRDEVIEKAENVEKDLKKEPLPANKLIIDYLNNP